MATRHFDEIASPPDDAGHQGSYTRPEDVMVVGTETDVPRPHYVENAKNAAEGDATVRSAAASKGMAYTIALGIVGVILLLGYCSVGPG